MRILMVTDFFPPILGGLERHVFNLTTALAAGGHEVVVVTLGWEGLPEHEVADGVKVYRITGIFQMVKNLYEDPNRRFHPPLADPLLVGRITALIRAFKPDIVHCHGWILYSLLRVKSKLGFPLVVTLHDYGLICPKRNLLTGNKICGRPFTRKCVACGRDNMGYLKSRAAAWMVKRNKDGFRLVDRFLAVSTSVRDAYREHLAIDGARVEVVPNFLPAAQDTRPAHDIPAWPDNFILYVGEFSLVKGVPVLLEAFARVGRPDVKLVLIGITHAASLTVEASERIIVLKNQPPGAVMEAWQKCLFGVVPSVWPDPCPTVALEGMSCGKALVASAVGGLLDIVLAGETGLLVPPGDADALSDGLATLLADRARTDLMGRRGRERFRDAFSLDRVICRVEQAYLSARQDWNTENGAGASV